MTLTPNQPETVPPTDTSKISEVEEKFNWKQCWYPVTFIRDLPTNRPYGFSLYDEPLVLFRNQDGKLGCLTDRCPHRAAKLSDGQIIDDKIRCFYHGWQFGRDGKCLHIPQLPAELKIPANSCVQSYPVVERQGIVWVWAGEPEVADYEQIPTKDAIDKPGVRSIDVMIDLPHDQAYLVEQALDPAHVPINHGELLGRRIDEPQPLDMEILESSVQGIRGRYRRTKGSYKSWFTLEFIAPNLVSYGFSSEERGIYSGFAIYSLPLGKRRCRLLLRRYSNYRSWREKLIPDLFEHFRYNRMLEEDLPIVVGQEEQIERLGKSLKEIYLPLKTSDTLVIEYRKWLDKFGESLPFYKGYSTLKVNEVQEQPVQMGDRFSRHTQICAYCNQTYQVTKRVKQTLLGVAIALATLGLLLEHSWLQFLVVCAFVSAVILAVVAEKVKTKFERSYTRK